MGFVVGKLLTANRGFENGDCCSTEVVGVVVGTKVVKSGPPCCELMALRAVPELLQRRSRTVAASGGKRSSWLGGKPRFLESNLLIVASTIGWLLESMVGLVRLPVVGVERFWFSKNCFGGQGHPSRLHSQGTFQCVWRKFDELIGKLVGTVGELIGKLVGTVGEFVLLVGCSLVDGCPIFLNDVDGAKVESKDKGGLQVSLSMIVVCFCCCLLRRR